jgi:phosphoglycolate phosphatase-like HAD superfamily hydrolase
VQRLLLFDIDGTLITSGGAGEGALCDAMRARFGVEETLDGLTIAGATDSAIAGALLARHNIPGTAENKIALLDAYLGFLEQRLPNHAGRLLPGILTLLERLRHDPRFVLGLLTGNLAHGARIKLDHFGVWEFFEFGAFADDHHDRNELGHFARARAKDARGTDFPPDRIIVLGDTPRDIACGKAIGARTVAIATGHYSIETLVGHAPDLVFADLADTDAVVEALATL